MPRICFGFPTPPVYDWRRNMRHLAMIEEGGVIAVRQTDCVDLITIGGGQRVSIRLDDVVDFAFVGPHLWCLGGARLHCFASDIGQPIGEPLAVSADFHRLQTAPGSRAQRAVLCGEKDNDAELVEFDDQKRVFRGKPIAELRALYVGMAAHHQLLLVGRTEVQLRGVRPSASSLISAIPPLDSVLTARLIYGGRAVFVLGCSPTKSGLIIVLRPGGGLIHCIEVPLPAAHAIAPEGGIAVLYLKELNKLAFFDLRLGRQTHIIDAPVPVLDLEIDPAANNVFLAGRQSQGGPIKILHIRCTDLAVQTTEGTPQEAPEDGDRYQIEDAPLDELADDYGPLDVATLVVDWQAPADNDRPSLDVEEPAGSQKSEYAQPLGNRDRYRLAAHALMERALCHAALLFEHIFYLSRELGLVSAIASDNTSPRILDISEDEIHTLLTSFRVIESTAPERRGSLWDDPYVTQVNESRAALVAQLDAPGSQLSGFAQLCRAFSLRGMDLDAFILALVPEWDLRIGRLWGFLNGDPSQRRPKLGHLLMLSQHGLPGLDANCFASVENSLIAPGIIDVETVTGVPQIHCSVRAKAPIIELSLAVIDQPRRPLKTWDQLRWEESDKVQLHAALMRELRRPESRLVLLEGPPGCGRSAAAEAVAWEAGIDVVTCEAITEDQSPTVFSESPVGRAAVKAKVLDRLLLVRADRIGKLTALLQQLSDYIRSQDVRCFVLVRPRLLDTHDSTVRFIRYKLPTLDPIGRRAIWAQELRKHSLQMPNLVLDDISSRYSLTPGRITEVAKELHVRNPDSAVAELGAVREALRTLTVEKLGTLANRYQSSITLSDLVFGRSVRERLAELIYRMRYRHRVFHDWSFADKAHESYGISALFSGPSGTGKTAAAAAVAHALEVDLYIVDLSSTMSKWVGETEQNLARVFDEAEASNVALLFDEADSLFGKRSSTQTTASDRYANLTVNYLLQRMERYPGLVILTTNMESVIDDAFQRRITTKIKFSASDEKLRYRLWQHLLPKNASYGENVDLEQLSRKYRLEGAHIQRVLTRAAFRCASLGILEPVFSWDIIHWAMRVEYEDMGRLPFDDEKLPFREPSGSTRGRN